MPMEQINNNGYQMFLDTDSVFAPQERAQERQAKQNALAAAQQQQFDQRAVRNLLASSIDPATGMTNFKQAFMQAPERFRPDLQQMQQADAMAQTELRGKRATAAKSEADAASTDNDRMAKAMQTLAALTGASVNESSYQTNLQTARDMGFDVSNAPANYDENYVSNQNRAAIDAAKRFELQATRERDLATVANQRGTLNVAQRNAAVNEAAEARQAANVDAPLAPKERQKREAAYPKASAALNGSITELNTQIKDLKILRDHPGLSGITGLIYGNTPALTADARAAKAKLKTILARGGFQELAKMRANSPTGGALGNVSDTEGRYLRDSYGSFDTSQDTESFQLAIDNAITQAESSKLNLQQSYDDTYSYRQGAAPAGKPAVGTVEDGHRFKGGNPSDSKNWEPI